MNPFEPPRVDGDAVLVSGEGQGLWRHGLLLVANHGTSLGHRCVACGEPVDPSRLHTRVFRWRPTWVRLLFLIVPVYIVLGLVLAKEARLGVALCRRDAIRRAWVAVGGVFACFVGLALAMVGLWFAHWGGVPLVDTLGTLVGLMLLFGGLVAGLTYSRPLQVVYLDEGVGFYAGAGISFLDRLPPWQGAVPPIAIVLLQAVRPRRAPPR